MEKQKLVQNLISILSKSIVIKKRVYRKNETITAYIINRAHLFILQSGSADLEHYEASGALSVIEHINANELFGDQFHSFSSSNELTVVAKRRCTVLAFDYNEMMDRLNEKDRKEVYSILFRLMSEKIATLNNRTALLTKGTTREKLLAYFKSRNLRYQRAFTLTYSYTNLADYLSVDRSAMMRELAHLEDDGIIRRNGREITLLT